MTDDNLFLKEGRGKAPNVPDTWELLKLSNRLNMPAMYFKLLVIIQTSSWTEGFSILGKKRLLDALGDRCSRATLTRMFTDLKERDIATRRSRGKGKTKQTRLRFNGATEKWSNKAWNSETYHQKRYKNQQVTDENDL